MAKQKPSDKLEEFIDLAKQLADDPYDMVATRVAEEGYRALKMISCMNSPSAKVAKKAIAAMTAVAESADKPRQCRICGCTDENCGRCIEKTGRPCHWIEWDLCSACVD